MGLPLKARVPCPHGGTECLHEAVPITDLLVDGPWTEEQLATDGIVTVEAALEESIRQGMLWKSKEGAIYATAFGQWVADRGMHFLN